MKSKTKKKDNPSKFEGQKCAICDRKYIKGRKFVTHHLCYEPEITAPLCLACHQRLHAQGAVFNHPFKSQFKRDIEPFMFAVAVLSMYDELLIMPKVVESLEQERMSSFAASVKGTIH